MVCCVVTFNMSYLESCFLFDRTLMQTLKFVGRQKNNATFRIIELNVLMLDNAEDSVPSKLY